MRLLKIIRQKRPEKLLPILYVFDEFGECEVSLSELLESVKKAQERLNLGYYFSEKILYSDQVFEELEKLKDRGYVLFYSYKHDGFFPKNYISLTPTGKREAQNSIRSLSGNELIVIRNAVKEAIEANRERYKIWSRPLFTERKQV